ncbi:MAG TPA: patatin-like phospholipase family protein [Candidatus Saccharimonadia bacterium]|nr:patatin-like phospholipase family protein [Candidatus Saccharimonadia bacterium]
MDAFGPDADTLATSIPWIAALPAEARAWLVDQLRPIALAGGATLFTSGEPSDALFVLTSGSLGAFAGDDSSNLLGQVVAGETVGELGLITRKPRMATVRALRDSELLMLDRGAFEALGERDPHATLAMARLALQRATAPGRAESRTTAPRTLALLPQSESADARALAEQLARALSTYGSCVVVDAAMGLDQTSGWFNALESQHRYVVYVAQAERSAWRELCLRQADALVFVADPRAQPSPWSESVRGVAAPLPRPEHLALLHTGKPRLGAGRRWARALPRALLHHIRSETDVTRLARLVLGKSVGLVLSGGGARGFAHLGVIKALREAGVTIDAVGGTSIGAIIGAGVAADWSTEEMMEVFRRSFVTTNPLSDFTIPLISMYSGRKVSKLLRDAFGEREIEDLVLPFFCVSSNLTNGHAAVHRNGPLWQWLRASVAIPGVLPPVFTGRQVYVDGGVINNLPVDVMQELFTRDVVAVDIGGDHALKVDFEEFDSPPWWRLLPDLFGVSRRPTMMRILLRAGMVNSGQQTANARGAASLLIMPPLGAIDLLDWKAFDRAVEIGYQHTLRLIGGPRDVLYTASPLFDV